MTKKMPSVQHDQNIIDALEKLPKTVFDKKHNLTIVFDNDPTRSNETRFEHISKKYHQLKVRDIAIIPQGINKYLLFEKDKQLNDTYCYYFGRGGKDDGFIKLSIKLYKNRIDQAYVKSIFITHRVPNKKHSKR